MLSLYSQSPDVLPDRLPIHVHEFLQICLKPIDDNDLKLTWEILKLVAWDQKYDYLVAQKLAHKYLQLFLDHRHCRGIGKPCILSTYYVHAKSSQRTYYKEVTKFLQIATHVFISSRTCELFSTMMVTAWTSATNCARIYNKGLAVNLFTPLLPASFKKSFKLDVEDIWTALFTYWLLEDCKTMDTMLQVNHNAPSEFQRLLPSLQARNARISGTGQAEWNHVCDQCCWVETLPDGQLSEVRGTTISANRVGAPSISTIHDCTEPLESVKDHFCAKHKHHAKECAVVACHQEVEPGYKTCALPDHRKHQLACLKVMQPADSLSASQDVNEVTQTADGETEVIPAENCNRKPDIGNRKLRARFGRRRTHNEQLCVASCGVIVGRATFFGSEALNSVRTFLMRLFPTKKSLPGVIWYDNNCKMREMLNNDTDPHLKGYFDDIALPVDVFHFKCKHKESDVNCNMYCNPYRWEELRTADGKWRFNSSAAEQGNGWFGGYQSIVREMQVDRYNFFLDEMIARRNQLIVADLKAKLHAPHYIPRHVLLSSSDSDFVPRSMA
ncbi:hypothetical protein GALMADRAFT_76032 [Galerina marginata CBS 339.88]|uniref:CxC6 like cysteine cluster associated with KDZ domain-containing protein n=1 Tax=Galerina marginata (strain CBS 339.88) TaxID=685588 RepID=A0A067SSE9_GALM3|nr:hypothetical protein GALMADRAFT_76032 [Galerina marginata CBS 339.88]